MKRLQVEQLKDPVDSSMMVGAFRATDGVIDAVPFFNAPLGCPFHILLMWSRHNRNTLNPYQSMIQQDDVIMGMDGKLELSLRKTLDDLSQSKKALLIISSDAAEIISPNTEEIARKLMEKRKNSVQIIPLQSAGLKGNHVDGFNEVLLKLLERFAKTPEKRIPYSVNLLGIVQDEITTRGDVAEVRRMLEGIGIQTLGTFLLDTDTDQISRASETSLNLALHEEYGLEAAQYLEKTYGMPYLCIFPPFGFEGTKEWLLEVADYFGRAEEAQRFVEGEERRIYPRIVQADQYLTGRRMAVYADPTMATGITRLAAEMGMTPVLTGFSVENEGCFKRLLEINERYELSPQVLQDDNINFKFLARDLRPHVIFGTGLHYELSVEVGAYLYSINYPTSQRLRVFDIPIMGYQGLLYTVQQIGDEMLRQDLFDETVHGARHVDEEA